MDLLSKKFLKNHVAARGGRVVRGGMEDTSIRKHIALLIGEEKALRAQSGKDEISGMAEQGCFEIIEPELDQCWDLLQQRAAKREFGGDPDEAVVRDSSVVEIYKY